MLGGKDRYWFSVRCVFRMESSSSYEERVTLWRAASFSEAIERAETEAKEYANDVNSEYVGLAQAYELAEDAIGDGVEVFSLIRDSELPPNEYLDRFFATGSEHQGDLGNGE